MTKWILALLIHSSLASAHCVAQALSVMPVNLMLPVGQRASKLTITNRGDHETGVQVRVYRWDQNSETDTLVPSDQVQVSPPMGTVAPGASQIIRIVLRDTPATKEATYRIILDEIPPPAAPGIIRVVLRMSIPVFVQPANRASSHLRFHLEGSGDDLRLIVDNDGGLHEKLRDVVVASENGGEWKPQRGQLPYVLAGTTRTWPLVPTTGPQTNTGSMTLNAVSDAGIVRQRLVVPNKP